MVKVFEAIVTESEAKRLLKTFSERAYVYAQDSLYTQAVYAQTISCRRMVLSWCEYTGKRELYLYVDPRLYESNVFWGEAFAGLNKDRFRELDLSIWDMFDPDIEGVCVGYTPPSSYGTEDWKEADYTALCKIMGVAPVDFEAELSAEIETLKPLLEGLPHVNEYELEYIARLVCGRIDRDDLDAWSLRKARIESVINRLKWEVLGHFEQEVSGRFPFPEPEEKKREPEDSIRDPEKPRRKPTAKKPVAKKPTVDA